MRLLLMLTAALLAGCTQIPDGVQAVGGFDAGALIYVRHDR